MQQTSTKNRKECFWKTDSPIGQYQLQCTPIFLLYNCSDPLRITLYAELSLLWLGQTSIEMEQSLYIWIFHIFHCSVQFHCSTDRMKWVSVCIHLQHLPICSSDKGLLLINVASFNYSTSKAVYMHNIKFAHFYEKKQKHPFLKNLIQLSLSITYISHCVRKYFRLSFLFASSQY